MYAPNSSRGLLPALALSVLFLFAPGCGSGSGEAPPPAPLPPFLAQPGDGVDFFQMAFLYPDIQDPLSPWGQMQVQVQPLMQLLPFEQGFVNVVSPDDWLIQNLPVGFDDVPVLTGHFDLGVNSGTEIMDLDLRVIVTEEPLVQLDPLIIELPPSAFPVQPIEYNAQGRGPGPVLTLPPPLPPKPLTFTFGALQVECMFTQPVVNVQAANNQCGPMSVANSLQYLEDEGDVVVPHLHQPGLNGDNTLVGQLDGAMNRQARSRTDGDTVNDEQFMGGKFKYESDNGIDLTHRFQQETDRTYLPTNGDKDFEAHGIKARDESTRVGITFEWIAERIKAGDDVEAAISHGGGGHWVRIDGVAKINGVTYVRYSHDAMQTDIDGEDKQGLETVWVPLVDTDADGKLNLGGAGELELVTAEG